VVAVRPGQVPVDDQGHALGPDGRRVDMVEGAASWVGYDAGSGLAVTEYRDGHAVPHIDLPADLDFVDDEDLVLAGVPAAGAPLVGRFLVAGGRTSWMFARVEDVRDGWVRLRRVDPPR
jgi:hypothetical protein